MSEAVRSAVPAVAALLLSVFRVVIIRSSAVAVIADRTAYNIRYADKLYHAGIGCKFTNGWYARSISTGSVYERNQTLSTKREH